MTIITDASGKPISLTLMPNDDNALTIIKGSINGMEAPFSDGAVADDGLVDIRYSLDDPATPLGTLKGFPSLLDTVAKGDPVVGVTMTADHDDGPVQGYVNITRRL
jgi:hypothetical protein